MAALILCWLLIGAMFAFVTYLSEPWSEIRGFKLKLLVLLGPIGPIIWWITH